MRTLYRLCLLLLAPLFTFAQNRVVLLEHFTQASCPPCAVLNPQVAARMAANPNTLIAIKYQTSWPGVDPMNADNPQDVQARVSYYGVNAVPHSILDGNYYSGSVGGWSNATVAARANVPARAQITLSHEVVDIDTTNNDSIRVSVSVKALQSISAGHRLHVVVIEREINFPSPPGTNGEKDFTWVMKKMLPTNNGTTLDAMSVGDSASFSFKWRLGKVYDISQLAVVAFVQNHSSKEVVGSVYSPPNLPLKLSLTVPNNAKTTKVLPPNAQQTFNYIFRANQTNVSVPTLFKFMLNKSAGFPQDWAVTLRVNNNIVTPGAEVGVPYNEDIPVEIVVSGSPNVSNAKGSLQLSVRPTTILPSYVKNALATVVSPSEALIIEKYNSNAALLSTPLTNLGVGNVRLTAAEFSVFDESGLTQENYKKIFLNAGDAFSNTITQSEVNILNTFLSNGGKLFVVGRDIAYEAFETNKPFLQEFVQEKLGAYYLVDGGVNSTIPLGKNLDDTLVVPQLTFASVSLTNATFARWSDRLELNTMEPNAVPVLFYRSTPDSVAAILNYNENDGWKAFYAGFMLEAFGNATTRSTLYNAVNKWFDGIITSNQLAETAGILQTYIYPNPAHSVLNINYGAGVKHTPALQVTDVSGREMPCAIMPTDKGNVVHIHNLTPGIYLLKVSHSNGQITTHKFVKQ